MMNYNSLTGMMELQWDKLLRIKTSGRDDSRSDKYRYPYEPTPYSVLERLAQSGYIGKRNKVLDYGCGKGRVDFFFAYQIGCPCLGVECDERIFGIALRNKASAVSGGKVEILCAKAEDFPVPDTVDRIFFFNPFSLVILKRVINRIRESGGGQERLLFFYYPSDDYLTWFMTLDEMEFIDEIDCRDLFEGENDRERIMVYKIKY